MSRRLRSSMSISAAACGPTLDRGQRADLALREGAVRQLRQRVVLRLVGDVRLARGDVVLHGVEGAGERAELLAPGHAHRGLVVALLDALRGQHQLADRSRGAAAEDRPDECRQCQSHAVDQQHRIAQLAVGRVHLRQWFQQDHVHRIATPVQAAHEAEVVHAGRARHVRTVVRGHAAPGVPAPAGHGGCDPHQPAAAVRDDLHLGTHQRPDLLRQLLVGDEAHEHPGDGLRRAHGGQEHLVRMAAEDVEGRLLARRRPARQQALQGGFTAFGLRGGRGQHLAAGVQHQHQVRADALRVVARGGEDGRRVAAGHRLAEAEVGRQHCHAVGQLAGAEADEVLGQRAARAQLRGGTAFHRTTRARQHCGQRHSLRDDDQADDQHEKSFAETTHEIRSNDRAHRKSPTAFPARIEVRE